MAFEGGTTQVKLYFMMGLPTETDEDVVAILELAQKVVDLYYRLPTRQKGKGVQVNVSVACFVPKPHTPFQFEPQDTVERFREKVALLKNTLTSKKIKLNYHVAVTSRLEAVLARGDRRLSDVIEQVWRNGGNLEGWEQHLQAERWFNAFEKFGLEPDFYACRRRPYDEVLPWDHLDYCIDKEFLIREDQRAWESKTSPNCREGCTACGARKLMGGKCVESV
jgi:radical SAM superfamily enzyme YgiQ (UPF0313 family)